MISPNWLGDIVMALPALQVWRGRNPDTRLAILARPALAGLWSLHEAVDEVIPFPAGAGGLLAAAGRLRGRFGSALILPNSFRSALLPALAGIPARRGFAGQFRDLLLTERVARDLPAGVAHQSHEMALILCPDAAGGELPPPRLAVPPGEVEKVRALLPDPDRPRYGLIPGAARGPSKRWPAEHFAAVGRRLAQDRAATIVLLGTPGDVPVCEEVRAAIGPDCVSLAGRTSLAGFAAALSLMKGVVANDSGGMHLAAALGTPVAGIFGITDPARTGPLGPRSVVLQRSDLRSRDIARDSEAARQALLRIHPDEVAGALEKLATGADLG
ncbi:MAG: lipopolysaccharide heptosyltransferase II [Kiritimatiellia bacterium]